MFQFNPTIVINANQDFTDRKGGYMFKGWEAKQANAETGQKAMPAIFQVKRAQSFWAPNVVAVYVRPHTDPEMAQVEIDLSGIEETGIYRIAMYLRLQGSENPYYANDYVFKGKPFFIEFTKNKEEETAAALATRVKKITNKYQHLVYENEVLDVTAEGSKVIFKATDEYQRFHIVEIQQFDIEAGLRPSCCSTIGDFVTIDSLDEESPVYTGRIAWGQSAGSPAHDLKGKAGFGTYRQLIKDLRLPTPDNRRWGGIIADEAPAVGATYTEYTIVYCKRVGIQGMDHVGDIVDAQTSHHFFVNDAVKAAWEEELAIGLGLGDGDTLADSDKVYVVEDEKESPTPEEMAAQN